MRTNIRHVALSIIIIMLCGNAAAKNDRNNTSLSKAISKIERANDKWRDFSADFAQSSYISILGKTIVKRGTIQLKKGGKFRISYGGANSKQYVSDGTTVWVYVPGEPDSMETYAVNSRDVPKEAMNFLTSFKHLRATFKIDMTGVKPTDCENCLALDLKPRSKKARFERILATFSNDGLIKKLVIYNKSGNKNAYTFSNIKIDTGIPDKEFVPVQITTQK